LADGIDRRSPADITHRLDRLIKEIRSSWHSPIIGKDKTGAPTHGDVLVVAHGHILRAFAMRWLGKSLSDGITLLLEAGGVGTLRYVNPLPLRPAPTGSFPALFSHSGI